MKRLMLICTSLATLMSVALGVTPSQNCLPQSASVGGDHYGRPTPALETMGTPESARGGRGPEHCALSVGIFLGGALGFFANPFLGTAVMRLGFMAAALHCA